MSITAILIGLIVYNVICIAINLSQMIDRAKEFKAIQNEVEKSIIKKQYRKSLAVSFVGLTVIVIQTWLLVYCVNKLA